MSTSADLNQYINIERKISNKRKSTTFKLVVAGTIALTASVLALS